MPENTPMNQHAPTLDRTTILHLVHAEHGDPFSVLGPHLVKVEDKVSVAVRVLWPGADHVAIVDRKTDEVIQQMARIHHAGLFEALLVGIDKIPDYCLRVVGWWGQPLNIEDAYAFGSGLSTYDLHLLREGTHHESYEKLGSQLTVDTGVPGVRFAVWAPNARRVSVVGDFNEWDGRRHPMRLHPDAGVWEIFIPRAAVGARYKFEIASKRGGPPALKADPYAFYHELRPQTASVVCDISDFKWTDDEWMTSRRDTDWNREPVNIYEVHLGSWLRDSENPGSPMSYRVLADRLGDYMVEMGYTHIELLPITEFPYDPSWGYQPLGQFSPTSRYGTPKDFQYFVDHIHEKGIGVILDWVPAHFPKDAHGLARFDGTALFEHPDPRRGEHMDWGSLIYDYGRFEVRNYLITAALFWLDKYHIDGLRVDAVASMLYLDYSRKAGEWLPNEFGGRENLEAIEFIKMFNSAVHERHPGVLTIAEESTSWPMVSRPSHLGGLGFSMKWNMGWMHDTLEYFQMDPIFRKFHQHKLTFGIWYAWSENFVLSLSHDEVVHLKKSLIDKMPGDLWMKFAQLRLMLSFMYAHPGKKLLFMGAEFGQWHEWQFEVSLHWNLLDHQPHASLLRFSKHLNKLYKDEPALHEVDFSPAGFEWIDCKNAEMSVLSWIRFAEDRNDYLVFVANFTPVARYNYRVGVPDSGHYEEIFNSDSGLYWGSNVGNLGGVVSEKLALNERPYSVSLTLPPLGMIVLRWFVEKKPKEKDSSGTAGPQRKRHKRVIKKGPARLPAAEEETGSGTESEIVAPYEKPSSVRSAGSPSPGSDLRNAGKPDAGKPDAGKPDAGKPDAGKPDAGKPDAGKPDAVSPKTGTDSPDKGPDSSPPGKRSSNDRRPQAKAGKPKRRKRR